MRIKVSPALPLFLFSLLVSSAPYIAVFPILAAILHELGHLIAARLMRIPIISMELSVFGAVIEADVLRCSYGKEALLALCGPAANIITAAAAYLLFGAESAPPLVFIVSSLFLAALNLTPAGSLDGGRVFSALLNIFFSPRVAAGIAEAVSFLCFFALWSVSVYFILRTGAFLSLFIFSWSLFIRIFISGSPSLRS